MFCLDIIPGGKVALAENVDFYFRTKEGEKIDLGSYCRRLHISITPNDIVTANAEIYIGKVNASGILLEHIIEIGEKKFFSLRKIDLQKLLEEELREAQLERID